ncbi:putative F420-dependent oxidoreductase, MSMEG_2249 family [Sphingobium chlorophenolicum L-1]|uniref:Putative F420-dependent oxidoreductase, MSMEG_2249 family n=1 Tax=Sphingobium chlorophenolicum L-1 TaxID=690566 RepID=F6EUB2_SPHCR|nr:TIGR03857 family LLM class F420-dependent oxidoreductase [Sphingobium chlorophenolicum]AEG49565.1 putative F420-dependent oxidoreductase, MSMEG_2249 family [Sphingobium chlorophenolicum L-1]
MSLTVDQINCYILPGRIEDVREGLEQAAAAETLGLGGIFLSERWETKEIGSAMGALSQRTQRIKLVAGLTHFGTRHPLVLAGMASTMQSLSGNRFILGFGRSVPARFKRLGIPIVNNGGMADHVAILRKLWAGETVTYDGPAGQYPEMRLGRRCDNPPPVILGAIGPKTLALGGAHFDGILLHPFLTPEGVARSIAIARKAAEEAGRDPDALLFYATVVAAVDGCTAQERASIVESRIVSYLRHREIGTQILDMNGWDRAPMERLLARDLNELDFMPKDALEAETILARAAEDLPPEWLSASAAIGGPDQCIARLHDYIDAGASQILLHGPTPRHQAAIIGGLNKAAS